jgi:hypothetical protein
LKAGSLLLSAVTAIGKNKSNTVHTVVVNVTLGNFMSLRKPPAALPEALVDGISAFQKRIIDILIATFSRATKIPHILQA